MPKMQTSLKGSLHLLDNTLDPDRDISFRDLGQNDPDIINFRKIDAPSFHGSHEVFSYQVARITFIDRGK